MNDHVFRSWITRYGWPLMILLLAAALRFHDLAAASPGLTHDEADHGLTAWQIASEGLREIYFTIGYGREPLYDYAVAALMTFLGPTIFAGRLVSVFAGLILIAGTIAWTNRAFGRATALMTGAGLAAGFWPLMSSRQALRSILLPMLFVLALLLFWLAFENVIMKKRASQFWSAFSGLLPFIGAGVFLGVTFYTYIPARALWIVFPALLLYWLFKKRAYVPPMWWRTGVMLLAMILIASPLLLYLQANPGAEVRIRQLAEPLYLAQQGDWPALAEAAYDSLLLFFVEGDPTWRYNIFKKPFLTPLFGFLFVLGLLQALWWMLVSNKDDRDDMLGTASFLSLSWLAVGFLPVLITGPELSMTQAIAVQPLIYLFPAVALAVGGAWITARFTELSRVIYAGGMAILFALLALGTYRDYFQTWANHPQVRVQYESTMVTAVDYLNANGEGEALISTITPGEFHSPALALMTLKNDDVAPRWFDGRGALLLPNKQDATMIVPGFTPLSPALVPYLAAADLVEELPLREDDYDRPLKIYRIDRQGMIADWQHKLTPVEAEFDDTVTLLGYDLQTPQAAPGEEVRLVTLWRAERPLADAVIFTHLLGAGGVPLAQVDRLDVPGYSWGTGDTFLQAHTLVLPGDIAAGDYPLATGIYEQPSGRRLSLTGGDGDIFSIDTLSVAP